MRNHRQSIVLRHAQSTILGSMAVITGLPFAVNAQEPGASSGIEPTTATVPSRAVAPGICFSSGVILRTV